MDRVQELRKVVQEEGKPIMEEYARKWLDQQKDSLLLQLIGHLNEEKAKLERKEGSTTETIPETTEEQDVEYFEATHG